MDRPVIEFYETFCAMFRTYDTNDNGFLDRQEGIEFIEKLGANQSFYGIPKEEVDAFAKLTSDTDADGDGKIDREEFVEWMINKLAR